VHVEVLDAAEREAIRAARWYEVRRKGLGADFICAITEAYAAIAAAPRRYRRWQPGKTCRELRVRRLRRFPYLAIYEVRESENRVIIAAIAAAKRRPGYWLYRLRS
jgi:plasmid stabilization system protein ParE